jgi:hypothetical protein
VSIPQAVDYLMTLPGPPDPHDDNSFGSSSEASPIVLGQLLTRIKKRPGASEYRIQYSYPGTHFQMGPSTVGRDLIYKPGEKLLQDVFAYSGETHLTLKGVTLQDIESTVKSGGTVADLASRVRRRLRHDTQRKRAGGSAH